jgi:hypothetical protein
MPLDIFIEGCIIDPGLHHARPEVTSVHDFRNPACRSEIEVMELSPNSRSEDSGNPRCRCGSEMKKVFCNGPLA